MFPFVSLSVKKDEKLFLFNSFEETKTSSSKYSSPAHCIRLYSESNSFAVLDVINALTKAALFRFFQQTFQITCPKYHIISIPVHSCFSLITTTNFFKAGETSPPHQ